MRNILQTSSMIALGALLTVASVSGASVFSTTLSGANEVPAVATGGTGLAVITLSGNTLSVSLSFSGLTSSDVAGHIHCCGPLGVNEVVAVPFTFLPTGVTSGTAAGSVDLTILGSYNSAFVTANGGTASTAEAALIAGMNSGMSYVNIHTTQNPGGEIRGQLAAVPEPATMFLAGSALGALALLRRRRLQ